jgi:hypothetical protein
MTTSEAEIMYDDTPIILKQKLPGHPIIYIALILSLLFTIRFLNLSLKYHLTKSEVESKHEINQGVEFDFTGMSGLNTARERLNSNMNTTSGFVNVVGYYDFLHHMVYLVYNHSAPKFIEIGRHTAFLKKGFTQIFLFPSDIIKTVRGKNVGTKYFGNSLLKDSFNELSNRLALHSNTAEGIQKEKGVSFILHPLIKSKYLKISYYIYCFLPLLIIIFLSLRFTNIFFLGYFIYLELFLLFDPKLLFASIPFGWLINLLKLEISNKMEWIISGSLLGVFTLLGIVGFFFIDEIKRVPWAKYFFMFFLMLPIFLRF